MRCQRGRLFGYVAFRCVRCEPSHRSEMTSQLLWGEPQQILDAKGEWLLVRGLLDGFVGWVPVGSLMQAFRAVERWAIVRVRCDRLFVV